MSLYPLFFLIIVASGWIAALLQGPIWGLLAYIFVYFNIPSHQWWGGQLPLLRWSLISAGILIASCLIHRSKLSDYKVTNSRSGLLLVLVFIMVIITSIFSPYPEIARQAIYDFFRYVLIYLLISKVITTFNQYRSIMMVMLGTLFYFAHTARSTHIGGRLEGFGLVDANDSNMLAALVLLLAPFYVAFMFSEKGWKRFVPVIPFAYVVNMFILCQSRGALIGLFIQVSVAFLFIRKKIGILKSFIMCIMFIGAFYLLLDNNFKNRIIDTYNSITSSEKTDISSGRTSIWTLGEQMIADFPFGSGGKTFEKLSNDYLTGQSSSNADGGRAAHNTYLRTVVELGAIGLAFYLLFISSNVNDLLKNLKINAGLPWVIYIHRMAFLISISGFIVSSFFIDRLFFEAIYIVLGLTNFMNRENYILNRDIINK